MTIQPENDIDDATHWERYRIKFRLSDGRLIYATDGRGFHIASKMDLVADPRIESIFLHGAYTVDLGIFGQQDFFASAGTQFLTITETIPDPVDWPIDESAFVLGGIRATEFAAQI